MVRKAKNAKPEKPDKRQRTINTFFTKSGDKKQIKHPNGGVFKMRGKGWFLSKKLSHLNDRINYFKNLKWVFLITSCQIYLQILTLTEVIELFQKSENLNNILFQLILHKITKPILIIGVIIYAWKCWCKIQRPDLKMKKFSQ